MLLIDAIQQVTGETIAMDNNEFVFLKTNKKVEQSQIQEAEALVEDKKKESLRFERDGTIVAFRWRIERNTEEIELGLEPTDNRADLLRYVQYLRDLPLDPNFPEVEIKSFEGWIDEDS